MLHNFSITRSVSGLFAAACGRAIAGLEDSPLRRSVFARAADWRLTADSAVVGARRVIKEEAAFDKAFKLHGHDIKAIMAFLVIAPDGSKLQDYCQSRLETWLKRGDRDYKRTGDITDTVDVLDDLKDAGRVSSKTYERIMGFLVERYEDCVREQFNTGPKGYSSPMQSLKYNAHKDILRDQIGRQRPEDHPLRVVATRLLREAELMKMADDAGLDSAKGPYPFPKAS